MTKTIYNKANLMLLALFMVFGFSIKSYGQITATIGTGTAVAEGATANPLHGSYQNFRYQVVYTAAELSASGIFAGATISSMGFSVSQDYNGGSFLNYKIAMAHTTATNSASHNTAILSTVKNAFSYDPTVTAAGSFDMISLDNPFVWNGTDNLLIDICSGVNTISSPNGGVRVSSGITSAARYIRNTTTTTLCGTNTSLTTTNKPNIRFVFGIPGATCYPTSSITINNLSENAASVNWTAPTFGDIATGYNYELRTSGAAGSGPTGLVANGSVTTTSVNLATLVPGTNYTIHVMTDCGSSLTPVWTSKTFTTPTYIPVALAGFNADVVANGIGSVLSSTNFAVDDITTTAGYTLVAEDFRATPTGPAPTRFLPDSRKIYNGVKHFAIANYSLNNALRLIGATQTGTVTFLAPKKANNVYITGVSGSASSTVNVTINFVDNGTPVTANGLVFPDWYQSGTYAQQAIGRVNRVGNALSADANGPNLYEVSVTIPVADQGRAIASVSVTTTAASTGKLHIMGVSILPSAIQSCALPSNVTANTIGANTASIAWTGNGTSTQYQISYGFQGTTAESGTIIPATGTTQTLNGLSSASYYQAFVRAICGTNVGDTSEWVGPVTFTTTLLPCSGAPTAGTVNGPSGVYNGSSVSLTVSGNTLPSSADGISFQWQQSPTGIAGSWTNIAGTAGEASITQTGNMYYRYYNYCSFSNLGDTSSTKYVVGYCVPSYSQACVSWRFTNVTLGTINNTVTNCTTKDFTNLSTNLSAGIQYPIAMTTIGFVGVAVAADFNNDGDFTDAGELLLPQTYIDGSPQLYDTSITIPASIPAGIYRLRTFTSGANGGGGSDACGSFGYGTFHDYTINVSAAVFCTGTPAPGNTNATNSTLCLSGSTTLSLQDSYATVAGITYQWQQYDNGINDWINIAAATNAAYSTPIITATTQYRCAVTCNATTSTGYSNPLTITVNPLPTVTVTPNQTVFCNSGTATLLAAGAATYTWSPATGLNVATGSSVDASPTVITLYTVTGTDINGCVNTAIATVSPITALVPVVTINGGAGACVAGTNVGISVAPIASPSGVIEYQLTDNLANVVAPWQTSTSFTVAPPTDGAHIYNVYARNTDCPTSVSTTPGVVTIYVGFTADVVTNNASCANGDGTIVVNNAVGPNGPSTPIWYANEFSTNTLIPAQAALGGVATITGGRLQLTPNTTSQKGGITILNPQGHTGDLASVEFNMTIAPAGADGLSYSFGNDVDYATSPAGVEAGAGTKLILSFSSYNSAGVYLKYNGVTLASDTSNNSLWINATNKPVKATISADNKLTLTIDGTIIFNQVQLPAAYGTANKTTWKQLIAARTGGISELHAIDDLVIKYKALSVKYGASPAHSGVAPTTWQDSPLFGGLTGGDSLDIWVGSLNNPGACNKFLGTYGVTAPVVTSLYEVENPSCVGAEDGYMILKVNAPGSYDVAYNKNGGGTITQTGIIAGNNGTIDFVYFELPQGVYDNIVVTSAATCVSNALGPITLIGGNATGIVSSSYTTSATPQTGAGTQYYTDAGCALLAAINSPNNLGDVTAAVTVGSTTVSATNGEPFLGRYYEIEPTLNATLSATLTLYFTPADFAAYNASALGTYPQLLTDGSNLRITAFHGTAASGTTGPNGEYDLLNADLIQPSSVVLNSNNFYEVTFLSPNGFSGFFANTNTGTPLNIALGNITAKNDGARNIINWSSKTENTGNYFVVEQSKDGKMFTQIGRIAGKEIDNSNYELVDNKPHNGVTYYRVAMMNVDGQKTYSNIVSAMVKTSNFDFNVFPNPVNNELSVSVSAVSGKGYIEVADVTGKVISTKEVNTNGTAFVAMHDYAAGLYLITYRDDAQVATLKVNKK